VLTVVSLATLVTSRPPDLFKFLGLGSGGLSGRGNGFRSFGTFTGLGSRLRRFGAFAYGCGHRSNFCRGCGRRFDISHGLGIRHGGFWRCSRLILASLCGLDNQRPFLRAKAQRL
jgi:hypothetical protein